MLNKLVFNQQITEILIVWTSEVPKTGHNQNLLLIIALLLICICHVRFDLMSGMYLFFRTFNLISF